MNALQKTNMKMRNNIFRDIDFSNLQPGTKGFRIDYSFLDIFQFERNMPCNNKIETLPVDSRPGFYLCER